MSEWIKCSERMPLEYPAEGVYADVEVLVTDGVEVHQALCASGCPLTDNGYKPWVEFSEYGCIAPSEITHWMPLPEPPTN
jgi:hypothetical protein